MLVKISGQLVSSSLVEGDGEGSERRCDEDFPHPRVAVGGMGLRWGWRSVGSRGRHF